MNSLSGYIERPDGKWLTFSIQANHHTQPTKTVLAAIDSLVVEMGEVGRREGRIAFRLSPFPVLFPSTPNLPDRPCSSSSSATPTPATAIRRSGPTTATGR